MRPSRRFHLVLPGQLEAGVRSFATRHGLSLAEAIRSLTARSLSGDDGLARDPDQSDSAASLAALVAAEHAALMVASVLPDGERRMRDLAHQAAAAAQERLAMFREPVQ
jgi:hypothetical protein